MANQSSIVTHPLIHFLQQNVWFLVDVQLVISSFLQSTSCAPEVKD
jgi:hypothetical protein